MASQYKIILSVAVLLAAALAARLCPAANAARRTLIQMVSMPKKTVVVVLRNNLEGHENLEVHCIDAANDVGSGVHKVAFGESTKIEFWPDHNAYCSFGFNGEVHLYHNKFDIYQNGRDEGCGSGLDRSCTWVVKEKGPCFHDVDLPEDLCFSWDQNLASLINRS